MKIQPRFKAKILYIVGALIGIVGLQYIFLHFVTFREFYLFDFYPAFSGFLRMVLGWFPFSIGDVLYVIAGVGLLLGIISLTKHVFNIKKAKREIIEILLRFIAVILTVYLVFLLFWGLNYRYNRLGATFHISMKGDYSVSEIEQLCDTLVHNLNNLHYKIVGNDSLAVMTQLDFITLKKEAVEGYNKLSRTRPSLAYAKESVKPSMFGQLMNYSGVTGYYNPFTGEAQVNTTPPTVSIPFTTCHEIAHQLGFAAEQAANFVGYYVASKSKHVLFQYSANFSLFLYAINVLGRFNRKYADSLWKQGLMQGVRKDYQKYFMFFRPFETGFHAFSNQMYDQFLKANEQKKGIKSYRGVVALVLSYKKEYGVFP